MSNTISNLINKFIDYNIKNGNIQGKQEAKNIRNLKVQSPKDSKTEKVLDKASDALNFITVENTAGTLLAPVSILSGLWSLGRAQNVKGREAGFKAMAMDAAVDYVSLGKNMPPIHDFPTLLQAATGQGIGKSLNFSFHNDRERKIFNDTYSNTVMTLVRSYRTPEGRKAVKQMIKDYKAWKHQNPKNASFGFFLK